MTVPGGVKDRALVRIDDIELLTSSLEGELITWIPSDKDVEVEDEEAALLDALHKILRQLKHARRAAKKLKTWA